MKKRLACLFFVLSLIAVPVWGRDSDEPFQDPADSNPIESLRRVGRLMSRLAKKNYPPEELEKIEKLLEDRLTRTLLTLEQDQEQSNSNGGAGGKGKRPPPKDKPQQQSGKKRQSIKHKNSSSHGSDDKTGEPKPEGSNENKPENEGGNDGGKTPPPQPTTEDKYNAVKNKDRWGKLPAKERDALELNLKRDVPDGFEEDMKDFLKRVKEIK